ncbi:hypothetical protein ABE28_008930 [Peribacillus muralis]|uniref:Uncharacterized protein n=1 Tax=Peribacillus muralis TaxID=264697 RepID=A0A1B3XMP0_9BACI|nr:hypothetical protein [Peribacillus muralis]AOH54475.1 hypothetical protein ABE28_008930 [Peribacillus muralis]
MELGQNFLLVADGLEISADHTSDGWYCLELVNEDDLFFKDLGVIKFDDLINEVSEGKYKLIKTV